MQSNDAIALPRCFYNKPGYLYSLDSFSDTPRSSIFMRIMEDLEQLNQKVTHLTTQISNMSSDMKDIKGALLGNELNPNPGIVKTIIDHDERIEALEKKFDRTFWIITGLAGGSGAALVKIIETIFKS